MEDYDHVPLGALFYYGFTVFVLCGHFIFTPEGRIFITRYLGGLCKLIKQDDALGELKISSQIRKVAAVDLFAVGKFRGNAWDVIVIFTQLSIIERDTKKILLLHGRNIPPVELYHH